MQTRRGTVLGLAAVAALLAGLGVTVSRGRDVPFASNRCGPSQAATRAAFWTLPQGPPESDEGTPWSVAFGPDATTVAVGGGAGRTLVWDLTTGRSTCLLSTKATHWTWEYGKTDSQVQVVGMPSRDTVVTRDTASRVWNTRNGRIRRTVRFDDEAVLSSDGRRVALMRGDEVTVLDAVSGRTRGSWAADPETIVSDLSGDGSVVATTRYPADGETDVPPVELHRVSDGRLLSTVTLPPGTTSLQTARLSADGRRVATEVTSDRPQTLVWDVASGRPVADTGQEGDLQELSPDGSLVAMTSPEATVVVEVATGRVRVRLPAARGLSGRQARFSADGRRLAVILDGAVGIWPMPPGPTS